MNNPTRKTTSHKSPATHKGVKVPVTPLRLREIPNVDDLEGYTSTSQIDPWRGQFVQIGWEHYV